MHPGVVRGRVVIVGGGVAGLSTAIDIARCGHSVLLLERWGTVGGKMRQLEPPRGAAERPRPVDAGPTVLTMRWVIDELFAAAGAKLDDHLHLVRQEPFARHFFADGGVLDLYSDIERTAAAIDALAGSREADGYRRFVDYAARIFRRVEGPFLREQKPSLAAAARRFGISGLVALWKIDVHRSMWRALSDFFADPRVRRTFARFATYSGCSPLLAPATYNLIAHIERQGVFRVRGGMFRVAQALAALARRVGATIQTDCTVAEIVVERGRATGVVLDRGQRLRADAVVWAGDVSALASGRLGRRARAAVKPVSARRRSLSAIAWAALGEPSGRELLHHNVFFSRQPYPREFEAIFEHGQISDEPTVYLCAQDRDGPRIAPLLRSRPAGSRSERMLLLINAAARGDDPTAFDDEEVRRCERKMHDTLQSCGLTLHGLRAAVTAPPGFEQLCPSTGGAIYGNAAHGWRSMFAREGSRSAIRRLYLAGGSVHPGPGVPLAVLSGRRAAESVRSDLASTTRSRRAAISGGISTWSAMTGARR